MEELQARYDALIAVNREQLGKLTKMYLTRDHLRGLLAAAEALEVKLAARVKHLEDVLVANPFPGDKK